MKHLDNLILALDTPDLEEIKLLLDELVPPLNFVKIGPVAFLPNSLELTNLLKKKNLSVMFDFKFFDIPTTITNSLGFLFDINTKIFTIHSLVGPRTISTVLNELKKIEEEKNQDRPEIFGVTVLTSFDDSELNSVGLNGNVADNVLRLAEQSIKAGVDGIVCSGDEIELIRNNFSDAVKILVPGVRLESDNDDQRRVVSPKEAIRRGADFIVLGRTLTNAKDRKKRINDIVDTLGYN
jgi:orotidine-5'-phosphate decarboxylase|tara:strand:- start:461 stop:1174 length:714 start_codon:yes stop_codon:yes gene_type:complete